MHHRLITGKQNEPQVCVTVFLKDKYISLLISIPVTLDYVSNAEMPKH